MEAACARAVQLLDAAERHLTVLSVLARDSECGDESQAVGPTGVGRPAEASAGGSQACTRGWHREGLYRVPASTSAKQALFSYMVSALEGSDRLPGPAAQAHGERGVTAGRPLASGRHTQHAVQGATELPLQPQRQPLQTHPPNPALQHTIQPVTFPAWAEEEGVTATVKAYLINQLPAPLLLLTGQVRDARQETETLQNAWLQLSAISPHAQSDWTLLARKLLDRLHPTAQTLVFALLKHMQAITAHSFTNHMGQAALSTVLGPCFLPVAPSVAVSRSAGWGSPFPRGAAQSTASVTTEEQMRELAQRAAAINHLVQKLLANVDALHLAPLTRPEHGWECDTERHEPVIPRYLQAEVLAVTDGTVHDGRCKAAVQSLLSERAPRALQRLESVLPTAGVIHQHEASPNTTAAQNVLFGLNGYVLPVHPGTNCSPACHQVLQRDVVASPDAVQVHNGHGGEGKQPVRRKSWATTAVRMLTRRKSTPGSLQVAESRHVMPSTGGTTAGEPAMGTKGILASTVLGNRSEAGIIPDGIGFVRKLQSRAENVTARLLCLNPRYDGDEGNDRNNCSASGVVGTMVHPGAPHAGSQRALPVRQLPASIADAQPTAEGAHVRAHPAIESHGEIPISTEQMQAESSASESSRSLPGRDVQPDGTPLAAATTAIDHVLDLVVHDDYQNMQGPETESRCGLGTGTGRTHDSYEPEGEAQDRGKGSSSGSAHSSSSAGKGSKHQYMHSVSSALSGLGLGLHSPCVVHTSASGYPYTAGQTSSETHQLLVRETRRSACRSCSVLQQRVLELENEVNTLRALAQHPAWQDPSRVFLAAAQQCQFSTEQMEVVHHVCAVLRRSNAVSVTTAESSSSREPSLQASKPDSFYPATPSDAEASATPEGRVDVGTATP